MTTIKVAVENWSIGVCYVLRIGFSYSLGIFNVFRQRSLGIAMTAQHSTAQHSAAEETVSSLYIKVPNIFGWNSGLSACSAGALKRSKVKKQKNGSFD